MADVQPTLPRALDVPSQIGLRLQGVHATQGAFARVAFMHSLRGLGGSSRAAQVLSASVGSFHCQMCSLSVQATLFHQLSACSQSLALWLGDQTGMTTCSTSTGCAR